MTPSFMGRTATMLPGVRPSISLASLPTASTRLTPLAPLRCTATTDGSFETMPLPLTKVSVVAVPRSIAKSFEKRPYTQSKSIVSGSVVGERPIDWHRLQALPVYSQATLSDLLPFYHEAARIARV